ILELNIRIYSILHIADIPNNEYFSFSLGDKLFVLKVSTKEKNTGYSFVLIIIKEYIMKFPPKNIPIVFG
ncbi:hypothetical protein, partial [Bacteroides thetaiotaomicron]|uniref:hypothetical protein n=1 Tax=Bacteroides thetaiotaomicron TaxID=818 RepID=UPI00406495A3